MSVRARLKKAWDLFYRKSELRKMHERIEVLQDSYDQLEEQVRECKQICMPHHSSNGTHQPDEAHLSQN